MLNDFVTKKNQMGTILRNAEEMSKMKRFADILSYISVPLSEGWWFFSGAPSYQKLCTGEYLERAKLLGLIGRTLNL
jgi:hypothetical protein